MIRASHSDTNCKPCKKVIASKKTNNITGIFTTLLLVLLPKCPFCFMAYTSTVVLCGNGISAERTHTFYSTITLLVALVFCCIALSSILFNYRDTRTKYALLVAAAGSIMIVYSISVEGGLILYYAGVVQVFLGAWLNGSLFYIIRKVRQKKEMVIHKPVL